MASRTFGLQLGPQSGVDSPGRGDGTFDPAQKLFTGAQPWSMVVSNLNTDTKPDVAVTNLLDGTVSIFPNRTQ